MLPIAYDQLELEHQYFTSDLQIIKNQFSYFSTKTCVVGAQKNRLNEIFSTQKICLN